MKIKIEKLIAILKSQKRLLVAFSGGVDSTLLLHIAVKTLGKENVLAVTATSETYCQKELMQAKETAKKIGVKHIIIKTSELKNKNFKTNSPQRCFYCKNELFAKLKQISRKNSMTLCDANNFSDLSDYRPGRIAAKKHNVLSPLEKAGLTKEDIRKLAKIEKLSNWNTPAQACLASRIPYGTPITKDALEKVHKAEEELKKLGFKIVRVRHHGTIARIEIGEEEINKAFQKDIKANILKSLKKLGWAYVTVDLNGYRTGSLNIF
ncbi:MAG: ATP-dependent sacrificial sulfur transferase LarE [Endomicrobiales bacterium]|nr:ATP-dependent sacrificial sulfur transferase LarE [Endomicrobiales bacterium]